VRDIAMGPPGSAMVVTANRQQSMPQVYTPSWQGMALPWFSVIMKLRQPLTPEFGMAVRRAVFEVDSSAVVTIRTLDEVIGGWSRQQKQTLLILQVLSALALSLAAFGVFSVTAYSVVQRRRELGMRLVLGATPGALMRLVLGRGLRLGGLGVVAGLVTAAGLSRFLAAMLFETKVHEPLVYAAVGAGLLGATALACWLPARRAGQVNPVAALRAE
ncbi:MAG: FtsX-like permease family protein, partial [Opitutaceae bacterium]